MSFEPPAGRAFHVDLYPERPAGEICDLLIEVVAFLRRLAPVGRPLRRYHDWWEHDGLHFARGEITPEELERIVEAPSALHAATPDDHAVFLGVAPEDARWYLRLRVELDEDDRDLTGGFAVFLGPEDARAFRERIVPRSKLVLAEDDSRAYFESFLD